GQNLSQALLVSLKRINGETKAASSEIPSYFLMLNTFVSTSSFFVKILMGSWDCLKMSNFFP
ncbi:hypothetical protein, partial [uncultured Enterococcus sp.]|uniref:hypothetical protein n=1 Tax=uncultured Enterococcus sp. TaxID=167972 RepID=UPI0025937C13